MVDGMSNYLINRWLASPLAIWGKLPSHGDFLRHNVNPVEAHDWQEWSMGVWAKVPRVCVASRQIRKATQATGWMHLEPARTSPSLNELPVAFVMQPRTLPFAKRCFVVGVALDSEDSLGRSCPLVIYQKIPRRWMSTLLSAQAIGHGTDMLFWAARLMARTHAANADWSRLVHAVDALGQLYAPGWRNLFWAPPQASDPMAAQDVLQRYCPSDNLDVAKGLHGVSSFPWRNWPDRLLRPNSPVSAYWQQDIDGGYVNAAESLVTLSKGGE